MGFRFLSSVRAEWETFYLFKLRDGISFDEAVRDFFAQEHYRTKSEAWKRSAKKALAWDSKHMLAKAVDNIDRFTNDLPEEIDFKQTLRELKDFGIKIKDPDKYTLEQLKKKLWDLQCGK